MSKKLDEYTKEELLAYIVELKKGRRFGLVWEPKDEQVVKDCEVKLPVLKEVENKAIEKAEKADPTHLLIEGDNYHSLTTLNYTHAGKVDVIYADPPYNTGSNTWIYNNRIVDSNDTYRHSKWLSFMSNRLTLARELLKDTGIITVTIDDYEVFTLGMLMDEVFGEENRIGVLAVENNPRGRTANRFYATSHEYYLVYAKDAKLATITNLPLTEEQKKVFKYEDEISPYRMRGMRKSGADSRRKDRPKQFYPIYINAETLQGSLEKKDGWVEVLPIDNSGSERVWIIGTETCKQFLEDGTIIINKTKDNGYSLFVKDRIKAGRKPRTVWVDPRYDTSSHGATLLLNMFGEKVFDYPKSLWAVRDFLYTAVGKNKDAIVLDFFAGSGTTGHAVLELNNEDGGRRQFILCTNNENGIAENVTHERINRVINGYKSKPGIPANLRYFKTDFVDTNGLSTLTDKDKLEITKEMGCLIALRENTFDQIEQTDHWQTYENSKQLTAIYYREDKTRIQEYLDKLNAQDKPVKLYVFGWGKNAGTEYASKKIRVEDIPEPLIEVYKELAK